MESTIKRALNVCRTIRSEILSTDNSPLHHVGICGAIREVENLWDFICNSVVRCEIQKHFITWSEYSNDPLYPVPSTVPHKSPQRMYLDANNLWEGEYGAARMRLLEHCILELKNELTTI